MLVLTASRQAQRTRLRCVKSTGVYAVSVASQHMQTAAGADIPYTPALVERATRDEAPACTHTHTAHDAGVRLQRRGIPDVAAIRHRAVAIISSLTCWVRIHNLPYVHRAVGMPTREDESVGTPRQASHHGVRGLQHVQNASLPRFPDLNLTTDSRETAHSGGQHGPA